jgi:hypothetical protein
MHMGGMVSTLFWGFSFFFLFFIFVGIQKWVTTITYVNNKSSSFHSTGVGYTIRFEL